MGVGMTAMHAMRMLALLQSTNTSDPFSDPIAKTASC